MTARSQCPICHSKPPRCCWSAYEADVRHKHSTAQLIRNTPDETARDLSAQLRGELATENDNHPSGKRP